MKIKMVSREGKSMDFYKEDDISFEEASKLYDNDLMKVFNVIEDKFGDLTISDAKQYIVQEGIGYAVMDYIGGDEFADPKLRELWNKANILLNELEKYVGAE